jgi:serine/threonine protein kinase
VRCAGQPELRAEVEKLLAQADDGPAEVLGAPGPLNVKTHWSAEREDSLIGRRVGPYEIQRRLGVGGMGCVYLAVRCEDYDQRVAIKVIKPGQDSEDILRRFRNERQVLAGLRHPNIASVVDGGKLEGRPYFVMEYIDGKPIDQYCADRGLSLPARLRLFLMVCAAVHHAHQNLILHRDLKPGNILVDATGMPKLLDFGIAKVLTPDADNRPESQTQTGHGWATLEYASPEQLSSDALPNTTGDIYSLGVILYELLTNHRPHKADGCSPFQVMRAVCEQEPIPPRQWHPNLPLDLEVICLKCLHKEPDQRFPSAASLAEELERFLADLPIQSRRVGVWERSLKWGQRRPAAAGLIGVGVLALGALLAVNLWYNRQLEGAVTAAVQAKSDLQQQKDRADTNLLITLGLLEKRLVGDKRNDQKEWLGRKKRQDLQEILDRFQVLRQINSDSPQMMQLRAQAYGQMAIVQELLGESEQAERSLGQARGLQEALRQESPDNLDYQHDLATTLHELGRVLTNGHRAPGAEEAYREAIRLRQILVAVSAKPAYRDALARHFHNLGNLLARDPARQRQARQAYQEAIQLHGQLTAERPDPAYKDALSQHRYKLSILEGAGLEEKEKVCRQRINDLEALVAHDPESPTHRHNLAMRYHEVGNLLARKAKGAIEAAKKRQAGRPPEVDAIVGEAEDAFQRAVELHEQLARANQDMCRYRHRLAQHYVNLGDLFLWTARQPQKARAPYAAALDLFKDLVVLLRSPATNSGQGVC